MATADRQPRYIVIHEDDIASSHGANTAFVELFDLGVCTSGAVMVPCPWFPEIAAIARRRPDLDLGVHLTLNAEMAPYRWRPLTGVSGNGLCDPDGYFWADVPSARRADPAAVEAELRAQVDAALAAGIDVTHLDSHMGTVMMPEFLDIYLRLGEDYRLPILVPRNVGELAPVGSDFGPETAARYEAVFARLGAAGNPDFQRMLQTPWGHAGDLEAAYRAIFARAEPGLSWLAVHFNAPGEIEAYSTDAALRIAEYEFFGSGRGRALIEEAGLTPVGMRHFRDSMRAGRLG